MKSCPIERSWSLLVVVAAAAALLFASGCGRRSAATRVVLITIDTLRPDHLSSYGYERATDRDLAWLAEEGVVFRDVSSTTSWTAPALASLMTSLHPHQHRVRDGSVTKFLQGDHRVVMQEVLPAEVTTLAEALAGAGFETIGLSASPHTTEALGFAQGFALYETVGPESPDPEVGRVYADGRAMRDRVDRLRQRIRESSKLFLWIHYLDPHHPYVARDPFAAGYRAESGGEPWPKLVGRPHSRLPDDADTEQERRKLVGLYDSEVAFVAAELAALLEDLSLDDEALIVLTSDHGEAFYEHGYWGHSAYLFEQELRVPLIIRFPSSLGLVGQVDTAVSILDVAPTILEVAGVAPLAPSVGRSLVPLARGASEPARPIFAELVRHGNRVYAVRRGPFKLIDDRRRGVQELFDLEHDPGEERNLLEHPTPEARAALPLLRALLREHREAATAASLAERQAIGAEEAEALRALGYVE